jgi:hypothetical protein
MDGIWASVEGELAKKGRRSYKTFHWHDLFHAASKSLSTPRLSLAQKREVGTMRTNRPPAVSARSSTAQFVERLNER